jgi:hypothetical protein
LSAVRCDQVCPLAGGEELVVAHRFGGKPLILAGDLELVAEHAVGARVARSHEDPKAFTGIAIEQKPRLARVDQRGVAGDKYSAVDHGKIAADAAGAREFPWDEIVDEAEGLIKSDQVFRRALEDDRAAKKQEDDQEEERDDTDT